MRRPTNKKHAHFQLLVMHDSDIRPFARRNSADIPKDTHYLNTTYSNMHFARKLERKILKIVISHTVRTFDKICSYSPLLVNPRYTVHNVYLHI